MHEYTLVTGIASNIGLLKTSIAGFPARLV